MKKTFFSAIMIALALGLFPFWPANALTISPPRMEYSVKPGDKIVDIVKVSNETKKELTIYSEVKSFTALDEEGAPKFYEPQEGEMANWIDVALKEVTLAPGEKKEVGFTINVPQNADPGGHYAAILWAMQKPGANKEKTPVSFISKTGHLILVRVAGDIKESGRILDFGTKNNKKLFNNLPVDFVIRFENTGNVHLKPLGQIEIKNMFGQQKALIDANPQKGNVLPNSVRRLENSWSNMEPVGGGFFTNLKNEWNNFGFGRYTADLALAYGSKNETLRNYTSFWIFPWRILLLSLIALILLVILIKLYNKWIISRASKKISE